MPQGLTAVLVQPGKPLELEMHPTPEVEPGGLLIRNTAAAICGSDLHYWRNDGHYQGPDLRRVPGHEFTGVVHTLEAQAASSVRVSPGVSAPVALSFESDEGAPDAGDLENKKKKKKKRKGEESEEEYRFTSHISLDALQRVDPDALEAMLVVSTAAVGPVR